MGREGWRGIGETSNEGDRLLDTRWGTGSNRREDAIREEMVIVATIRAVNNRSERHGEMEMRY